MIQQFLPERSKGANADRPARVKTLKGVIFQSDGKSTIGRFFIRPFEAMDRWIAGVLPSRERPSLAMHAGLHLEMEDGREFVAEQLVGTLYMDFLSGLNWTPLADFQKRDRGGWDITIPATAFRGVDDRVANEALNRLNAIEGRPFVGEDCTAFVERAFGDRRLFADSPLLRAVGLGARVGDPALPLLKKDAQLDERARMLLHADALCRLPDAIANPMALNVRTWTVRLLLASGLGMLAGSFIHGRRRSRYQRMAARLR